MDILGLLSGCVPCLWECSAKHAAIIRGLEDNLESLRTEMGKLENLRVDVRNRVKEAEEQHMKRTDQVKGWLQRVDDVEKEVNPILHTDTEEVGNKCPGGCCPKNCWSSYKLGKEVPGMIPRVTGLIDEEQRLVIADHLPPPPVDEQPMDNVVVGFESKFEEVWQSVRSNEYPVIGLVGMGGVGKTTLLKQLNNEFLKATHGYDLVIWIVVSRSTNPEKIRDAIRSKLNIPDDLWKEKNEDQRVSLILEKLKKKKFVMLLDDMWERLELSKVGIPHPNMDNMSKLVFTTRDRKVCWSMDAYNIIQVGCLPPDQALTLFCSKLGKDFEKFHSEMRGLVTDVVSECDGLPLALITIGRAMRGKKTPRQWRDAKIMLKKYPSTFENVEGSVFSKLLFSYDSLPNPMVKKCFEYCSLYPEDHNIIEEDIILLWLAEGLIGEYDSMYDALIQGRQIMERLKHTCLLETGKRSWGHLHEREGETVKMHDMIRDMALWIACERGKKENKFCVEVASTDTAPNYAVTKRWSNAEKISLWRDDITTEYLAGMSSCPNLTTLIIHDSEIEELPAEIVHSVKVLNLRYNRSLKQLPIEKGCLANLEYLNVVSTQVKLPVEVPQWKKLRFLIVAEDTIIPRGLISSLCSLQMFEQLYVPWPGMDVTIERESTEREMLQDLKELKHIMEIRLALYSVAGIEILLDSLELQRCTTRLALKEVESLPDTLDFGTETLTKHLERFEVGCCLTSEIKLGRASLDNNLCEVSFFCCRKIKNLSTLVYAPNLCTLDVQSCESIEELIGEETRNTDVGTSLFSCLTFLHLYSLKKLRSICPKNSLPFPSLKLMYVRSCNSLRKLPFDRNTANTTPPELEIQVHREWWDRLEWDSQATKDAFTPKLLVEL